MRRTTKHAAGALLLVLLSTLCLSIPVEAAARVDYDRGMLAQLDQRFREGGGVVKRFAGNQRELVRGVQTMLRELGYPILPSGAFDQETKQFVQRFQKRNGLTQDGCVNQATWNRLLSEYRRVARLM